MEYSDLIHQAGVNDSTAALFAGLGIFILIIGLILIAFLVVYIVALVKLFKKAGKPGWAAIVPFYNVYVLVEIAGLNWWYFLIYTLGTIIFGNNKEGFSFSFAIISMAVDFFIFYNLGKKFKKDPTTYGILGMFFMPIMTMVLGFGSAEYDASIPVSPNGPIGNDVASTTASEERYCLGCGKRLPSNVKFCQNCGKEVDDNKPEEKKEEQKEKPKEKTEEKKEETEEKKDDKEEEKK